MTVSILTVIMMSSFIVTVIIHSPMYILHNVYHNDINQNWLNLKRKRCPSL